LIHFMLEAQKKKRQKIKIQTNRSKKLLARKINNKIFNIQAKADDKGTLYSKVSAKEIAKELQSLGYAIEAGDIILNEAIKKIGEYKVELNLFNNKAEIKIIISNKDDQKQKK